MIIKYEKVVQNFRKENMIQTSYITSMKIVISVFKKNRRIVTRAYPWSFIWSRVSCAVFALLAPLLLYYFVFKNSLSTSYIEFSNGCNYLNYIVLGQVLNVLSFSTLMNVGRCLITEQREGTLENFLLSPASRFYYYIGTYIEQFGRSLMEATLVLIFGFIVGVRIDISFIPSICFCIIFSSIAFFSLSILVSTIMIYFRDTYLVQNTLFLIMSCICGVVFPIEYFPKGLQILSQLFPLTYSLKLIRQCSVGTFSIQDSYLDIFIIICMSVIYFFIGYIGFRKYETKLIEDVLA